MISMNRVATSVCIFYTLLYVGVIYLSPITRPRPGLNRNSSFVIRARVRAATIVTMLCVLGTSGMLFFWTRKNWWNTLSFMGFAYITPQSALDIIRVLLLTSVLFAGPFLERLLSGVIAGEGGIVSGGVNWVDWRNYVIAPLTEEIVFRACMVPLQVVAGVSPTAIIFLTPLVFGIAHFHHAYEFLLNYPGCLGRAAVGSAVQFTYTTIFGWYAVFILLRTGSIWPVVAVHTFCNWMGAPGLSIAGPRWLSFMYWILLLGGVWGFYKLLWPLTESVNALVSSI
ncbi:hypothetical protein BDD12DRAFT_917278 [Trichophaea hybrida]|nr:hypothetical protein BDD12DRAFT_917278 [Trichophaea hybrida]